MKTALNLSLIVAGSLLSVHEMDGMTRAEWRLLAGRIFSLAIITHANAHFLLSGHDLYTFAAPIETHTVYGAALAGLIYLGLSFKGTST